MDLSKFSKVYTSSIQITATLPVPLISARTIPFFKTNLDTLIILFNKIDEVSHNHFLRRLARKMISRSNN